MRRALLLLVFLPALILAVVLLWRSNSEPPGLPTREPDQIAPSPGAMSAATAALSAPPAAVEAAAPAADALPDDGTARVAVADAFGYVGRVIDDRGQPIEQAAIRIRARRNEDAAEPINLPTWETLRQRAERDETDAAVTTTDADGKFRLAPPVVAAGGLQLLVLARGHRPLQRAAPPPAGRDVDVGGLVLERGAVLAGRVTQRDGKPVPAASVRRTEPPTAGTEALAAFDTGNDPWPDELDASARTDADGRFEIAYAPAGPFALQVRHADYPRGKLVGQAVAPGEERRDLLVVLEPGASIVGRVLGIPAGVSDLSVTAHRVRDESTNALTALFGDLGQMDAFAAFGERFADVGGDGSFAVRGLAAGQRYRIWVASAKQSAFDDSACSEKREVPAGTSGIELRYDPGVSVSVRVVDARSGAPVSRLVVRAELGARGSLRDLLQATGAKRAVDYPDGLVTITGLHPMREQRLRLRIESVGYALFSRDEVELPRQGGVDLGTVRLAPVPIVRVHVRNAADGAGVAGARVTVEPAPPPTEGGSHGSVAVRVGTRANSEPAAQAKLLTGKADHEGHTDADGWCALNSLPGQTALVRVSTSRHAPYVSARLPLPEREDVEHDVSLIVGGEVAVTAVDDRGQPIAEATVEHRGLDGDTAVATTDVVGVVQFTRLPPGRHGFRLRGASANAGLAIRIDVSTAAADQSWRDVDVVDGQQHAISLVKPPTAALRGQVREDGIPLRGAAVDFVAGRSDGADSAATIAAETTARLVARFGGGECVRTDAGGAYQLVEIPVGAHRLRVTHPDRAMSTIVDIDVRVGDNTIDVDLDTTALVGRVVDPQAQPVERATIAVEAVAEGESAEVAMAMAYVDVATESFAFMGGGTEKIETDADGGFELRGVRPDTNLVVIAKAKGFATARAAAVRVHRGDTLRGIVVTLERAGRIRVRVTGKTEAIAFVTASCVGNDSASPGFVMLRNGRATLEDLRPGRWSVTLGGLGDEHPEPKVVEVRAGETAEIEF